MYRLLGFLALTAAFLTVVPQPADAQYFGRNKVQYNQFQFQVLPTERYDIHFYPEAEIPIEDAARMAERWYERTARILQHDIRERRPLVLYADHPDFQQTNILRGRIGEGTGGVTEGLRDRIIMPLGNSYAATDHVLGHEIIHSFQFDIAQSRRGPGLQGLMSLPLWFVEGQAEHLSMGPVSSLTGMWLRDALLNDEFPTLQQMSRNQRRYFPYRFGHAFWSYVGGTYGDEVVGPLLRASVQMGWRPGIERILGVSSDTLSAQWERAAREHYGPRMEGRTPPGEAGTLLLSPATGAGRTNVSPSISPDGRWVAFLSERDLFTIELFLADARTGEIVRAITSSTRDAHFDALRFIDSSGGWSPDSEHIAISVFAEGRNRIEIYDVNGNRAQRVTVPEWLGEIRNPMYSPDGRSILFSGQSGGVSNLFTVEIESGEIRQLTDDRHAAFQPVFSPDGSTIAYVTDIGPRTNFDRLTFGNMAIGVLDVETGEVRRVAPLGEDAAHWNPQFTPDGQGLYFLADPDGFRDVFRVNLDGSSLVRVTNIVTAVSGITDAAPALTVARETGSVVFSVFHRGEYHIYALDAVEAQGDAIAAADVTAASGQRLPGAEPPDRPGRVESLLADPGVGMPAPQRYRAEDARPVSRSLGLDWLGQPTVGAGVDQFGTFFVGSIAASFSDILGDRTLFTGIQAEGELKDLGGQVFYSEVGRRWNWGLGAAHIPIRFFRAGWDTETIDGQQYPVFVQQIERTLFSQVLGQYQYPFSQVRRMEFSAGASRIGFDVEQDRYLVSPVTGGVLARERTSIPTPDALYLAEASAAFVGDNSFFGFTAPVRGWRYRFEVGQTMGSLDFTRVTADYRRYFAPHRNLTFGVRGMHVGRYGTDLQGSPIRPYYLGWETLVRGYSPGDLFRDCPSAACPEFARLFGQRLGVVNMEVRIPLLGTDDYGLIPTPLFPVDLIFFADGGVAWSAGDGAELRWERDSDLRIPVFSTGAGARFNLFGALVLEVFYAKPWQWPAKGSHWGVSFSPGW